MAAVTDSLAAAERGRGCINHYLPSTTRTSFSPSPYNPYTNPSTFSSTWAM